MLKVLAIIESGLVKMPTIYLRFSDVWWHFTAFYATRYPNEDGTEPHIGFYQLIQLPLILEFIRSLPDYALGPKPKLTLWKHTLRSLRPKHSELLQKRNRGLDKIFESKTTHGSTEEIDL